MNKERIENTNIQESLFKELISDQEICIKNTLQSLNEWKEYAERLEELIDKITEMLSQNKLNAFEKSFGKTNERTLEQAKIIIYNEILDLIKELIK